MASLVNPQGRRELIPFVLEAVCMEDEDFESRLTRPQILVTWFRLINLFKPQFSHEKSGVAIAFDRAVLAKIVMSKDLIYYHDVLFTVG